MAVVGEHNKVALRSVALDDISATEWRSLAGRGCGSLRAVALDDISATEWR